MRDIYRYKGYEISPASVCHRETGEWPVRVSVVRHYRRSTLQTFYDAANTFSSKAEAEKQSVLFAKKIIDGEMQGLSTKSLNIVTS